MREINLRHFDGIHMQYSTEFNDLLDYLRHFEEFEKQDYMQYTGLKDKNGVDIYEGDIVKRDNFIGEIKYDEAHFFINWKREACDFNDVLRWHHEDLKVIGNIHENKDML